MSLGSAPVSLDPVAKRVAVGFEMASNGRMSSHSSTEAATLPRLPPAAVLYTPPMAGPSLLAGFAEELKSRGWRVGGLVQEVHRDADGKLQDIVAREVDSGKQSRLALPANRRGNDDSCVLDVAALTEVTQVLRRAVAERVDLMEVDKFGEKEKEGEGLIDEILAAMAEGIPTLVAVSTNVLEAWNRTTGNMGVLLPSDPAALWRWWGPHRLFRELAIGIGAAPVRRVVVGYNWTMVEGPDGCGFAQTPSRDSPGCRAYSGAGAFEGRPLSELARLVESWNPSEAAIGVAAINAHYNRFDLKAAAEDGLDVAAGFERPLTVIGRFPGLAERIDDHRVVERHPAPGEYPESAAGWLLAESGGVVITASTLVDHSLVGLLPSCRHAKVCMVGPGTPLAPSLHAYGVHVLAGMVAEDADGAARTIAEGGSVRALKRYCRLVTIQG